MTKLCEFGTVCLLQTPEVQTAMTWQAAEHWWQDISAKDSQPSSYLFA